MSKGALDTVTRAHRRDGRDPCSLVAEVASTSAQALKPPQVLDPFFGELQERTFRFFWETGNPANRLIPDRYPTPSYSSIAAVGFGLTTYPVGVERGYVTRPQARRRV